MGKKRNLVATCKELSWLLRSSKGNTSSRCVGVTSVHHTSVQPVQLRAQKSIEVVKTEIELDLHADTCVINDKSLVIHDHNRPVNVFELDPNTRSKHACIVDSTTTYDWLKMGQDFSVDQSRDWNKWPWSSPSFSHAVPLEWCCD